MRHEHLFQRIRAAVRDHGIGCLALGMFATAHGNLVVTLRRQPQLSVQGGKER